MSIKINSKEKQTMKKEEKDSIHQVKTCSKVKIKSNLLFAFGNDHIYNSMCSEIEDFTLNSNNQNQSNFFSIANDSQWLKLNSEIVFDNVKISFKDEEEEENIDNEESFENYFDLRNNLDYIKEDDLNNAKLDNASVFSEKYSAIKKNTVCTNTDLSSLAVNPSLSNSSSTIDFNILNMNNKTIRLGTQYNCLGGIQSQYNSNKIQNVDNYSFLNEITNTKSTSSNKKITFPNTNSNYKSTINIHHPHTFYSNTNTQNNTTFNTYQHYKNLNQNGNGNGRNTVFYTNDIYMKSIVNLKNEKNHSLNSSKNNILTNEDKAILQNIRQFSKDVNKCRVVQNKFDEKKDFYIYFFEQAKSFLTEIICDPFGNYVCQKFIETCSDSQYISAFLDAIKPNLFQIAINSYGTRGLQKLIQYLSNDIDFQILSDFLISYLYLLINDNTGNHIVQQAIVFYPKLKNNFLYEEVILNIVNISKIKQGGCVMNKLFLHSNESQKKKLSEAIINNIDQLINDEFGNFLIQQVFKFRYEALNTKTLKYISTNLIFLCKQKFSSNVIDKCILKEDTLQAEKIGEIVIKTRSVVELCENKYGNYIIQVLLDVVSKKCFDLIIQIIKKNIVRIRKGAYGEKIYQSLMVKYGELIGKGY